MKPVSVWATEERKEPGPGDLFKGVAEALATLAGLAVFVYVIGGFTVLARLVRLELPAEAVIPEIPRERLALLGLSQLLWTLVLGGAIAALAWWLLPVPLPAFARSEWRRWLKGLLAALLLLVVFLSTPWSWNGAIYLILLLAGTVWFVVKGRERPVLAAVLALLVAGTITVLRELEFPARFTRAEVTLTRQSAPNFPEATTDVVNARLREARTVFAEGHWGPVTVLEPARARAIEDINAQVIDAPSARVIESTPEEVLIGFESAKQARSENATGDRLPPSLLVIPRDSVARLRYEIPEAPASHSDSIAQEIVGWPPVMCILPSCEVDDTPDVESHEPAWTAPFVF